MPRGRRTLLTPALSAAIVTAVSGGVPFCTACRLAGVSEETGQEWRRRGEGTQPGRPSKPIYANFATAIAHAQAQDEARRILQISKAAQGGAVVYTKTTETVNAAGEVTRRVIEERRAQPEWQADAFVLERAISERWGRKERIDLTVKIRQAAQKVAEEKGVTVEEVLSEAEALLREVGEHP